MGAAFFFSEMRLALPPHYPNTLIDKHGCTHNEVVAPSSGPSNTRVDDGRSLVATDDSDACLRIRLQQSLREQSGFLGLISGLQTHVVVDLACDLSFFYANSVSMSYQAFGIKKRTSTNWESPFDSRAGTGFGDRNVVSGLHPPSPSTPTWECQHSQLRCAPCSLPCSSRGLAR